MEVSMRGATFLALALGLSLSASSALAQQQLTGPMCKTSTNNLLLQVIRTTPEVHVYEFRGLNAKIGIALYNALPPQGHQKGDRFYILVKPGAPISHLLVGQADCLQDSATVDNSTAGIIRKVIEKAAAQTWI
jgi:hypothetical protein